MRIASATTLARPVPALFADGFGRYLLMPYLAVHLSGELALAGWAVGLVLGSFVLGGFLGGVLAGRLGHRSLAVTGGALRAGGFAVLGLVDTVPVLAAASAAAGFAGALSGTEPGEGRRAGMLCGLVAGLALTAVDFTLTCLVAAAVVAGLAVPRFREPSAAVRRSAVGSPDILVAVVSYVLPFQLFFLLPLAAWQVAGTALVAALFVVFGGVVVIWRARITALVGGRWPPARCRVTGLALMASAFVPPALTSATGARPVPVAVGLVLCAALLSLGMIVVPRGDRHVGGPVAGVVVGVGVLLGTVAAGAVLDLARLAGLPVLPWLALTAAGAGCAWHLTRPRWRLSRLRALAAYAGSR